MTAFARSVAGAWVEREERRTGSRMVAYEIVAQTVGTSASWLRKFLSSNSAEAKAPDWTVGWNIIAAYRRVCERVEQAAAAEIALAQKLRQQGDETVAGALEMVAREARSAEGGEE